MTRLTPSSYLRQHCPVEMGAAPEVEIASRTHDVFVMTSEHLHSRLKKKEEIQRLYQFLIENFDKVEVLCYFREQSAVVFSLYSTALKGESHGKLDWYVQKASPENYYYNYLLIADNWSGVFGRENCHFRIYDQDKFIDRDLRKDFIKIVKPDIDLQSLDYSRSSSNESLSGSQAAAFRVINKKIPYWDLKNGEVSQDNSYYKRRICLIDDFKKYKIIKKDKIKIQSRFISINEEFFKKYFGPGEKFPFFCELECRSESLSERLELAIESLIEVVIEVEREIPPDPSGNPLLDAAKK